MTVLTTASLLAPTTALPALRLVPAPASAPPYDDEEGRAPALRLVDPLPVAPPVPVRFDDEAWLAAARTATAALPPSRVFARTLVQGLLEVLAGVRPVKQLQRDTTPEVYPPSPRTSSGARGPPGPALTDARSARCTCRSAPRGWSRSAPRCSAADASRPSPCAWRGSTAAGAAPSSPAPEPGTTKAGHPRG